MLPGWLIDLSCAEKQSPVRLGKTPRIKHFPDPAKIPKNPKKNPKKPENLKNQIGRARSARKPDRKSQIGPKPQNDSESTDPRAPAPYTLINREAVQASSGLRRSTCKAQ